MVEVEDRGELQDQTIDAAIDSSEDRPSTTGQIRDLSVHIIPFQEY